MPHELPDSAASPSLITRLPHRWWWFAAVLLVACGTAFIGIDGRLALDAHEVFVAQSAEEMLQRDSFIVPYQNAEPRLKKPPLAYWFTMAVNAVSPGDPHHIEEFEARLPSVLSGIGLVALTMLLGMRRFGDAVGLIAGLLLATAGGFVSYTHSARPEMLYAFTCMLAITAFFRADDACTQDRPHAARGWAYAAWAAIGLALLAKGPQLPVLLVIGLSIGWRLSIGRGAVLPRLRPFTGIVIALLLGLWWYVAVWLKLPDALAIWERETIDRVLDEDIPWWRIVEPYYLYRTAGLFLPWIALYALAMLAPWTRELRGDRTAKVLWWIVIAAMLGLMISVNRRWYYMLPVMGPIALLMAGWIVRGLANARTQLAGRVWAVFLAVHALILAGLGVWLLLHPESRTGFALVVTLITIGGGAVLAGWIGVRAIRNRLEPVILLRMLAALVGLGGAFMIGGAASRALWRELRDAERDFAVAIAPLIDRNDPIFAWTDAFTVETYYLHRPIPVLYDDKRLHEALEVSPYAWVLIREDQALPISRAFVVTIERTYQPPDNEERVLLLRIRGRSILEPPAEG